MTRDGKFGKTEAVCLLTITMTSKVFFSNPAAFISYVGNSAWYATLIVQSKINIQEVYNGITE